MNTGAKYQKTRLAAFMQQRRRQLLAGALLLPTYALNAAPVLEEVIVSAQKRDANLQDTAVSVQVLGGEALSDLNVKGFDDYIQFLPTVSFDTTRPGVAQVYMRGISSGGDGNHSASMPSVGVYLDEQPITTINEVLDLHAYDIARIETLAGPQGTLFGASSQSGTLRIITNKPVMGEFEAGYDVSGNKVEHGDEGYTLEGFVNIPLADNTALRLVGWHDKAGGYIDNVERTVTFAASGLTATSKAEENFNDVTTTGMRALLKVDLNDRWTVTPGITYQEMKSNGVFSHDPDELGDLNTQEYFDTFYDEEWYQASLTVEGKVGNLDLVYAGAYLDRDRISEYDYTGYAEYLEDVYAYYGYDCLYYQADGTTCANPSQYVDGDENFNRTSHELRIQSSQDERLRFIAGIFYQEQEHEFDLQWVVPDMNSADSVIPGGKTTWQTHQVRNDQDQAIFGEVSFDITEDITALVGARYYEYDNKLYGFNGFIGHCTGDYINGQFVEGAGANVPQYPCFDTKILDGKQSNEDSIWKGNLTYNISDDLMIYITYSEGYRAGGVNRARVDGIPGYEEDFTKNYEFGWKTSWLEKRLRFNGAIYQVQWDDFQYSILDFDVSNLTIIYNAGQATVNGLEFDIDFAATDELILKFSGSYNDAELDDDIINDGEVLAPSGTQMPFVPEIQYTAIARYATDVGEFNVYGQAAFSYTDDSWSELDVSVRSKQSSYEVLNLAAGFTINNTSVDFLSI